jgi:hypothetical protein
MPAEGLVPDYDSYSAIILSYLKESVRAYRQFAISHPGEHAMLRGSVPRAALLPCRASASLPSRRLFRLVAFVQTVASSGKRTSQHPM